MDSKTINEQKLKKILDNNNEMTKANIYCLIQGIYLIISIIGIIATFHLMPLVPTIFVLTGIASSLGLAANVRDAVQINQNLKNGSFIPKTINLKNIKKQKSTNKKLKLNEKIENKLKNRKLHSSNVSYLDKIKKIHMNMRSKIETIVDDLKKKSKHSNKETFKELKLKNKHRWKREKSKKSEKLAKSETKMKKVMSYIKNMNKKEKIEENVESLNIYDELDLEETKEKFKNYLLRACMVPAIALFIIIVSFASHPSFSALIFDLVTIGAASTISAYNWEKAKQSNREYKKMMNYQRENNQFEDVEEYEDEDTYQAENRYTLQPENSMSFSKLDLSNLELKQGTNIELKRFLTSPDTKDKEIITRKEDNQIHEIIEESINQLEDTALTYDEDDKNRIYKIKKL